MNQSAISLLTGNECIHLLTNNGSSFRIRFDMINLNGDWLWAEYSDFSIGPESDKYRLSIHGYNGIAGNGITITTLKQPQQYHQQHKTGRGLNENARVLWPVALPAAVWGSCLILLEIRISNINYLRHIS